MESLNLYDVYSAIYDEELREEYLNLEEDYNIIDNFTDQELDEIVEEVLLEENISIEESLEIFEELLYEAKVTTGMGGSSSKGESDKVTTGSGSQLAAKARLDARRSRKRQETIDRIKRSAKRVTNKAKDYASKTASSIKNKVKEKAPEVKAAAKKVIKNLITKGRSALAKGLRKGSELASKAAAKVEPKSESQPKKDTTYRGLGVGRKETVGKNIKSAAKEKIKTRSTTYRGSGVGRKESASSGGVQSRGGTMGSEGSQGRSLPGGSTTKSGKAYNKGNYAMKTAQHNQRLSKKLGEEYDMLAEMILDDIIEKGLAETYEEAYNLLEGLSDYEVGEIAENFELLTEVEDRDDLFDYILEYLVAEGYADTNEKALAIMTNMSEEWRNEIVEDYKEFPTHKVMTKAGKLMGGAAGKSDPESKKKENRGIKMMDTMMQHSPDK